MILLPCTWCGPRDASEFAYVGEAATRPDPGKATRSDWRAYLYLRSNPHGWVTETWYHRMGCRRFLTVQRHTASNEIRSVRPAGQPGPFAADGGLPGVQADGVLPGVQADPSTADGGLPAGHQDEAAGQADLRGAQAGQPAGQAGQPAGQAGR